MQLSLLHFSIALYLHMLKIWRVYCRSMGFVAHLLFIPTKCTKRQTFPPLDGLFISADYLGALPLPVLRESSVQREVWPLEPPAHSSFLHAAHENFVPRRAELAGKGEKQDKLTRPSIRALVPPNDGGGVSLGPELRTYHFIWRFTNRDWLKHTHTQTHTYYTQPAPDKTCQAIPGCVFGR